MSGERVGPGPVVPEAEPRIDEFLGSPTRSLSRWRWLWAGDHTFPIRSDRGLAGRLIVLSKRLLRPFVKAPQNDLWERQRVFNQLLLEWLEEESKARQADAQRLDGRVGTLEASLPVRLKELLAHNDALFARLDQKVDLYRRRAGELQASLGAALAVLEQGSAPAALSAAREEADYLELERRYRGTEEEIGERLAVYLPRLEGRGEVLDLGCGRGESLALLGRHGIAARGVDASARMVDECRARGLAAEAGDLFEVLASTPAGSLGAVISFHVIEHLPPAAVDRLVRLAWRALKPGGILILETPNPLSLVVAARNFWLDPTHLRPIHPETLTWSCRQAGFEPVERLELRPFAPAERLPEFDLTTLPEAQQRLGHEMLRLRDRLDEILFGTQDYAIAASKPT